MSRSEPRGQLRTGQFYWGSSFGENLNRASDWRQKWQCAVSATPCRVRPRCCLVVWMFAPHCSHHTEGANRRIIDSAARQSISCKLIISTLALRGIKLADAIPTSATPARVWLKAFWGFDPASDGYLGFTRPADRDRFITLWQPGDLVLIYGADNE